MSCSLAQEDSLRLRGCSFIAGIDEAGRGPLAGPVVAAAVILPVGFHHDLLNDSKKLTEKQRDRLYEEITASAEIKWQFAVVDAEEIDQINILRATHEAMRRATAKLTPQPDHVLIDGLPVKPFPIEQTALVKGDGISFSIAAASVVAKVTRDRLMLEMHAQYPVYEFARHKGYATALHYERLKKHGPCPIHRRTFLPQPQDEFSF